jgi:hypothetical protein
VAGLFNQSQGRLCAVTLSVPEILKDILAAFRLETPELFGKGGFAQDFSSKTAVLGDKITAKIAHLPVIGDYDKDNGGFKAASQDVTTLIEDVPITLNQLKVVTVSVPWLTGLASKAVDLARAATANLGLALGKQVVDTVLNACATGVSHSISLSPVLTNLDDWDGTIRSACNAQRMFPNRWGFISTALATALGADDRVRSSLFYDERCASEGYRRWNNIAGFSTLREYPDVSLAENRIAGIVGDARLVAVSVRRLEDVNETAKSLGIRQVMQFVNEKDADSGLEMTGVTWQESGTGDIYLSAAILFGVSAGNQGTGAGAMTDFAGLKLVSI